MAWMAWKGFGVEAATRPLIRKIISKLNQEDVDNTEGTNFFDQLNTFNVLLILHLYIIVGSSYKSS